MLTAKCPRCGNQIDLHKDRCAHCGHGYFPNVLMAEDAGERAAVDRRYQSARQDAASRNCTPVLQAFEDAVKQSKAVLTCSLRKLEPIVSGARELHATYHDLRRLRFPRHPVPDGPDWDRIRPVADTALFGPENWRKIHYGALSLDGQGLPGYGECSIVLREPLIAERTSTFEENVCVFLREHMKDFMRTGRLPEGHRSTWAERHKLAVAKLGSKVDHTTQTDEFPEILLKAADQQIDDEFVELHIFESMTFATFESVRVTRTGRRPAQTRIRALRDGLGTHNVPLEIQ